MSDVELLDLSRLEIALGGDTSMIAEILEMYETTAASDLDALKAAVDGGDANATSRKAHSLKGASANVGANRVAAIAAEVEHAGREGDMGSAASRMHDLIRAFEATVAASRSNRGAA